MASKEYASYQRTPAENGDHCGACSMFRSPTSCTLVDGEVSRQGWCRFFESKKET